MKKSYKIALGIISIVSLVVLGVASFWSTIQTIMTVTPLAVFVGLVWRFKGSK